MTRLVEGQAGLMVAARHSAGGLAGASGRAGAAGNGAYRPGGTPAGAQGGGDRGLSGAGERSGTALAALPPLLRNYLAMGDGS